MERDRGSLFPVVGRAGGATDIDRRNEGLEEVILVLGLCGGRAER